MIVILYPKADRCAAEIAVKVQTLAQPYTSEQIYVIPKHNNGRSKAEIQEILNKASIACLVAHSVRKIDQDTLNQLKILTEGKKKSAPLFLPVWCCHCRLKIARYFKHRL